MRCKKIAKSKLNSKDVERMYQLFCEHFCDVTFETFSKDLDEKNWVILIENRSGILVGFSTILYYATDYEGDTYGIVYSGDTVVDKSAWSSFSLAKSWIKAVKEICSTEPIDRVVWLLISSGFRSYRFLPVFWKEYFPKHDTDTPGQTKKLIDHLATNRFGPQYDPEKGIVKLNSPQRLKEELAHIPVGKLTDPDIAFFNEKNPGHIAGDELVCFTYLEDDNLTDAGYRMVHG